MVNSQTTTLAYDTEGNVASVTDPNGQITTFVPRVITKSTDRNGQQSTHEFDSNLRLRTTKNPLGQTSSYTYDAQGNVTSSTDALNRTTSFTYDTQR